MIRTVQCTVVQPTCFSIDLDDSLDLDQQQDIILAQAVKLRAEEEKYTDRVKLVITDCSDPDLID